MTSITTEEAETLARRCRHVLAVANFSELEQAATMMEALAAERDLADEQIKGLSEERERWKDLAETADALMRKAHDDHCAAERRLAKEFARAEKAEAEAEKLRGVLLEMARQKRTDELETTYEVDCASFEDAHDMFIDRARAALNQGGDDGARDRAREEGEK